jgi:hypothetical protein
MTPPHEAQVEFLRNLQRLLNEGEFTATYKYALLMALADISVERGDDSGEAFALSSDEIAEKFVDYYWPQAIPFPSKTSAADILKQNSGRQATVIRLLVDMHAVVPAGRSLKLCDRHGWKSITKQVASLVERMPLWKLQTVAGKNDDFIYANVGSGSEIVLREGVTFCFRRFHDLITDLVRGAWLRRVRLYNGQLLGDVSDLHEFLFGGQRMNLGAVRPILRDLQHGVCFYCRRPIRSDGQVDHFIAWSRYPVDLGHNFVLAHGSCNSLKGNHLAAFEHLARWAERNRTLGGELSEELSKVDVQSDAKTSARVAEWAYSQNGGTVPTWLERDRFVPLPVDWERELALRS